MEDQLLTDSLVRRRCLVCDAEREVIEPTLADEIGPPCSACGAPTERIAVLRAGLVPKSIHAVALGRLGGIKRRPCPGESAHPSAPA
jgi:hypothetical protein